MSNAPKKIALMSALLSGMFTGSPLIDGPRPKRPPAKKSKGGHGGDYKRPLWRPVRWVRTSPEGVAYYQFKNARRPYQVAVLPIKDTPGCMDFRRRGPRPWKRG